MLVRSAARFARTVARIGSAAADALRADGSTRVRRRAPRRRAPHICRDCGLPFVRPESSAPDGRDRRVVLRCANCGWTAEEVLDQETLDRLQDEIDRGTDQLAALLALVSKRNERD